MKPISKTVDTLLAGLGVDLPLELLSRLDIEEYLDQLDRTAALVAGEREYFGDLLRTAVHVTPRPPAERLSSRQGDGIQPSDIPIGNADLLPQEQEMILDFQRQRTSAANGSGQFALGNILVASDQITRAQLERALLRQTATGRRLGEELMTTGDASKRQVENGLRLQKKLLACALAVVVGLVPTAAVQTAAAAQASAAMPVSATVIAGARKQIDYQATQLKITAADVAHGYVEALSASRFSVTSNSRSGYRIDFHSMGDFFKSVEVAGLGNVVRLSAEGGSIVQRGPLPPTLSHELGFRFELRPGTLPGLYPWPLQLSVQAL